MKWLTLFVGFCLAGCGGGPASQSNGTPAPTPQSLTLMAGPWNGTSTSSMGHGTSLIFANLTNQGGGQFFASSSNVMVCHQFQANCLESLPQVSSCVVGPSWSLSGTASKAGAVTATLTELGCPPSGSSTPSTIGTIALTGTLSNDGKSLTGTYTGTGDIL